MRLLRRNKQILWYANLYKVRALKDEYGNETPEKSVEYNAPERIMANVSVVDSDVELSMFGAESKDMIRICVPLNTPIKENAVFWYGADPPVSYIPNTPRNNFAYAGSKRSLNTLLIYAERVYVS